MAYPEEIDNTQSESSLGGSGYTQPTAPVTPAGDPRTRVNKLMDQLYSTREPSPQSDEAKAERLQRMGKFNAIGRGIGVLGDMLSLGLGGNVKRRAPDTVTPSIYNQYSKMLDQDNADQEAWKHRDFERNVNNMKMGINQAYHDEATDTANKRYQSAMAAAAAKAKQAEDWKELEFKQKDQFHQDQVGHLKKGEDVANKRLGIEQQRLNNEKQNQPISYMDDKGNRVDIPAKDASIYSDYAKQHRDKMVNLYPDMVKNEVIPEHMDIKGNKIPARTVTKEDPNFKPENWVIGGHRLKQQSTHPSASKIPSFFQ